MASSLISFAFFFLFLIGPFSAQPVDNILYSNEDLQPGDYLNLGIFKFIMQEDCNLVLYENEVDTIWQSKTAGLASKCYCKLEKNGNLVIKNPDGRALWASNSGGRYGHYVLILQKDKNVVIYGDAQWATGTNNYTSISKRGGDGPMDAVSIMNLPSPVIYTDGIDIAEKVTTGGITTSAGRVA